ncbi:hypothetical protein PF003_g28353 [Phytophthora fragariae]|nr:hypothetical protein PF003_g28353 [Phytophthora fragariae]
MERTEGDAWKELEQQQEFSIESIAVESLVDDWERLRYEDSSWDNPGDLQIEEDGDLRIEEDGDLPAGGACDLPVPGACDLPTISACDLPAIDVCDLRLDGYRDLLTNAILAFTDGEIHMTRTVRLNLVDK